MKPKPHISCAPCCLLAVGCWLLVVVLGRVCVCVCVAGCVPEWEPVLRRTGAIAPAGVSAMCESVCAGT